MNKKYLIAIAICFAAGNCSATTLYDNLANAASGPDFVHVDKIRGIAFNTDSASYNSLTAILPMSASTPNGPATLTLFSSAANSKVGSPLGIFNAPTTFSTTSVQPATFTLTGVTLSPNTLYWLIMNPPGSNLLQWSYTQIGTGSGVGFTNLEAISFNRGASWEYPVGQPNRAQIVATIVPEPSTFVPLAIGVVGLMVRRRFTSP